MAERPPVELPVIESGVPPKPPRGTMARWRFLSLGIVQFLIVAHVVAWFVFGWSWTPIEPSEAMSTVKEGVITVGTIFFAAAILSTLLFGRFFCGWGCHIILLQDACGALLRKGGLRPKPFRSRLLRWMPVVLAFYMFLWPLVHRFAIAPWMNVDASWPGFTWELTTTDFWSTFPGWLMAVPFLFVCGFLIVYCLGMKGYCTYACPYGGIFAPVEQLSPLRIRVDDSCKACGQCTAVCTSNVRVAEEVAAFGMVVDPGCMKTLDCVAACPNEALSVGFGAIGLSVPAEQRAKSIRPRFDLSWTEEIIFGLLAIGMLVTLRGEYSLPLLFASGVTAIMTWATWKSWRVFRDEHAAFHKWRLKVHGAWRLPGIVWVGLTGVCLVVVANVAVVNVMALQAQRLDDRVSRLIPPQIVFSSNGMLPNADVSADVQWALELYSQASFVGGGGWSLIPGRDNAFALRRAWLFSIIHAYDEAFEVLEGVIEHEGLNEDLALGQGRLLRLLDPVGIDDWFGEVLEAHPTWSRFRDDRILLRMDRAEFDAAIAEARRGVEATPDELLALRRLAVLLLDYGKGPVDWVESGALTRRTLVIEPRHPGGWRALAFSLGRTGEMDGAEEAMREAVRLTPLDHRYLGQLALLLDDRGKRVEAEEAHAEAMRLWAANGSVGDAPQLPQDTVGPVRP